MSLEIVLCAALAILALLLAVRLALTNRALKARFARVLDVDAEVKEQTAKLESLKNESLLEITKRESILAELGSKYSKAKEIFDRLNQTINLLEERAEDISFGVYSPHFDFSSSEEYRERLEAARALRKQLIKDNQAARCAVEWNVGGSKKEGARMTKQYTKLLLRAFNGETEAAIARVKWNNVTKMEERIKKAFEAINDLGSSMQMSITPAYLQACLDELHLEYESELKKNQELEEQRAVREKLREEEKAQKEFEKAQREAEQDESRYQKALDKARAELGSASAQELSQLNEKIELLEKRVQEAEAVKQRAISMAQQTRCGYLYVISNMGSLGEEVLKIGMTRRLDPLDRVRELGDASVPFGYDVHAMVYCEDAPALEAEIHSHFASRRVNRINLKREFFRVPLAEVEQFLRRKGLKVELISQAEAREYRETLALLKSLEAREVKVESEFPATLEF